MSTVYNGQADLISVHAAVNIQSSTLTTPIKITTATAHGLSDGDWCEVKAHPTNYCANGLWKVQRVSSTEIYLIGSLVPGGAPGGASGTVTPYPLSPQITIPADGDARSAASVNVALEACADYSAYLAKQVRGYQLISVDQTTVVENPIGTGNWGMWVDGIVSFAAWTVACNLKTVSVIPTDLIEISLQTTVDLRSGAATIGDVFFAFFAATDNVGAGSFASANKVFGSGVRTYVGQINQLAMRSIFDPYVLSGSGRVYGQSSALYLGAIGRGVGFTTWMLAGDAEITAKVWRKIT